jgi:hypothetical protein
VADRRRSDATAGGPPGPAAPAVRAAVLKGWVARRLPRPANQNRPPLRVRLVRAGAALCVALALAHLAYLLAA